MLAQLRNVNVDRIDLDEAVGLLAFGELMARTYPEHNLKTPEWLDDNVKLLRREVNTRRAESLEKRRKELQSRIEATRTAQERREAYARELAEVEASLGQAPKQP